MWLMVLRQIFCSHDWQFVRQMYGDEIVRNGYHRELWRCAKCWKYKAL